MIYQRFIVIEGGEGAGKSRLQSALGARLTSDGFDVQLTREPGGTPLGERVRQVLLADGAAGDPLAELLLFEAARAQLVASVIRPALEAGRVVLCDRYTASSVVYQGFGRRLGRDLVERANLIAVSGVVPALTLLLDLPVEEGLSRRGNEGDVNHFDAEEAAFHERVRSGYLQLAREAPASWRVIDASQPFEAVLHNARRMVLGLLRESA
jgi:dTMP kinase